MTIQQSCSVLCFATSSSVRDMLHALWEPWYTEPVRIKAGTEAETGVSEDRRLVFASVSVRCVFSGQRASVLTRSSL